MITREALADKFTYTPALDFPVGEGAASYCVYMMHLRSMLAQELQGYKLEVRLPRPAPARAPGCCHRDATPHSPRALGRTYTPQKVSKRHFAAVMMMDDG